MIEKVLVVEDHESASISVQKTMEDMQVKEIDHAYYCDDALLKIEKARLSGHSYDLLISDLYFEEDHLIQKITTGTALINAARLIQPELKVLVFSAESKPAIIDSLFRNQNIDGYVRKARNDARELREAFTKILQGQQHYPRQIAALVKHQNSHQFTDYDITIISLLAEGMSQKNIPDYLQKNQIKPAGLSSIEKRLNHIKSIFGFSKNEQLVAFCKDMGII